MGDIGGNRWRNRAFKEAVALSLQVLGIEHAHVRPVPARPLSEGLDGPVEPDILGLPGGWHVDVSAALNNSMSVSLDAAEQSADLGGREHAALVWYRQGRGQHRPTSDSYVLMSLATFSEVLKRDAEREAAS